MASSIWFAIITPSVLEGAMFYFNFRQTKNFVIFGEFKFKRKIKRLDGDNLFVYFSLLPVSYFFIFSGVSQNFIIFFFFNYFTDGFKSF